VNTLITSDGIMINLGSKSEITVGKGDLFRLETPGGGGFGQSGYEDKSGEISDDINSQNLIFSGSLYMHSQTQNSA